MQIEAIIIVMKNINMHNESLLHKGLAINALPEDQAKIILEMKGRIT
jgi:hydrogenase maturation factor